MNGASAGHTRGGPRDAFEGKGFKSGFQRRLGRRFEDVGKAVLGGYCRVQRPLKLAVGVAKTTGGPIYLVKKI